MWNYWEDYYERNSGPDYTPEEMEAQHIANEIKRKAKAAKNKAAIKLKRKLKRKYGLTGGQLKKLSRQYKGTRNIPEEAFKITV